MPVDKDKTAMIVTLNIQLRVIVDDKIDPEMGLEFAKVVGETLKKRICEKEFIDSCIEDYENDEENPYDYTLDN